jgi:hypothetical protein
MPAPTPLAETDEARPLASYVMRVRGRPATLRYELLDLRSGERHVFRRGESLLDFLRRHGLAPPDPRE